MTTFSGPPPETEAGIGALTLGGFLTEVAGRHRDREALAFHQAGGNVVRWTYGELESEARRVARALLAAGVVKGSRVALLMGNRPEWVALAYGVAMVGAVLVPLNTYFEPPELEYVLRHSDTSLLLLQEELAGHRYREQLASLCPTAPSPRLPFLLRAVCLGTEEWEEFIAGGESVSDELLDTLRALLKRFGVA